MAETTFEEARRCPFCQQPSKLVDAKKLPQGGKLHTFQCDNERCTDNSGRRVVQTNPDGSLAQRTAGPKTFEALNHFSESAQRARQELQLLELESLHPTMTRQELIRMLGG
jgi:hypothetical protein